MLAYPERLECGPWFSGGTPLSGEAVETRLRRAGEAGHARRPYSVYVHVPFCASICSFCALYTRAVPPDAADVLDEYLDLVTCSLHAHPWAGSEQPPTTVHFGGGTPLFLGLRRFAALVEALRQAFGTSPSCEWAVETTTSSLDADTIDCLKQLGVSRIHLGIQTLDDDTRTRVGRRETGACALERIRALDAQGFLTSIDLIIGFSGVGPRTVDDDLRRLHDAGVRMFSICELRERGVVRLGVRSASQKAAETYAIWQTIWRFMSEVGMKPIHLGQFARRQADNLYFTHPARGEDCVAIGPYAHSSYGSLYYSNLLLPDYYAAIRQGRAPIADGIEYSTSSRAIRALERELLAHQLSHGTLARMRDTFPDHFPALLARWIERALLVEGHEPALTLDGSWFIGNMVHEARALASVHGEIPAIPA